jgi:cysteinyl-tRNA synthetase
MPIRFANSLTRTVEEFAPLEPGKVRMYNCGPTVYSHVHIGNFRSFLFADLLRRFLEFRGLQVTQVMNITDVGHLTQDDIEQGEDKMQVAAQRERKTPWEIAEFYMNEFFEYVDLLNLRRAHQYPRATEHIPEMLGLIRRLVDAGLAYAVNGNVYFEVSRFPSYGRLSGNTIDRLRAGARIEVREEKRHPADFALWKRDPAHLMQWESPWGRGFPGWHIECSAMSMKYLGETFDIHTGGEDNIFPHHESEIAQSEAATGKPFVRTWMHARFLQVDGKKMSKSLGNFLTLRDLREKGVDPMALRYELMSTHYRMQQNFTFESLEASAKAVERLRVCKGRLAERLRAGAPFSTIGSRVSKPAAEMLRRFGEALDEDLNMSPALAAVHDFVRTVNGFMDSLVPVEAEAALQALAKADSVLGVLERERERRELDDESAGMVRAREEARARREFETADRIRSDLRKRGVILEDTREGTRWRVVQ